MDNFDQVSHTASKEPKMSKLKGIKGPSRKNPRQLPTHRMLDNGLELRVRTEDVSS